MSEGFSQADLERLLSQYKGPDNLKVPELNPELACYLKENVITRNNFFPTNYDDNDCHTGSKIRLLSGRICHHAPKIPLSSSCHYNRSNTIAGRAILRTNRMQKSIYSAQSITNPEVKKLLQQQKTDSLLFGKDLADKITDLNKLKKTASQLGEDKKPAFGNPPPPYPLGIFTGYEWTSNKPQHPIPGPAAVKGSAEKLQEQGAVKVRKIGGG